MSGCFAAGGTGASRKTDVIMRGGKTLCANIKSEDIRRKIVFQMDNDPNHATKLVIKRLEENKVNVLG